MKQTIVLCLGVYGVVFAAGLACNGCEEGGVARDTPGSGATAKTAIITPAGQPNIALTTVEHDGHRWVVGSGASTAGIAIAHHPACPCHTQAAYVAAQPER